jgi:hypothetical protein
MTWQYDDAIERRPGASTSRQFMMMCLVMLVPVVVVILGYALINAFQATQCPADALFWGGTRGGRLALVYHWMASAFGWLGCQMAAGRLERQGRLLAGRYDPALLRRWAARLLPVAVVVSAAFMVGTAVTEFCVMRDRISLRPGLFAATQSYPWTSVQGLVASCSGSDRGHERYGYRLVMADGRVIDLAYSSYRGPPFATIVRDVGEALRGVPYRYDASGVRAACDRPYKQLMLAPPTAAL